MDANNDAIPDSPLGRVIPSVELEEELLHDDFGPSVEACVWALAILAAGWLVLRLYLKIRKHRGLWWDDHLLAASWFLVVLSNTSTSVAISLGWGKEPYDIAPNNWPRILLALLVSGVFSILAAVISKTSFALTLLRISSGWVKCSIWFAIFTINIIMSLSIIFNWVQCTPVEKNFNVFVQGSCWPRETLIGYNAFASGYSGTVDFMLAFLPWKIIWKMDMSKKERFGAICAMSLGFFAGVISFVKIYALTGTFHADLDSSLQLTVLSVAETSITIMAASIPILRALARDKARPGGVKLFALNATEHVTLQGQPEPQLDAVDDEPSKADRRSRRVFRLVKKASTRRAPVLSNIMEIDELSPSMFGGRTAGERSFV